MDDHATQALGLAHDLSGLGSSEDYYATALARLHELFPCDQAFWTQTDFAHGRVVVRGDETCTDQLALTLGQFGADHPGILSYVAQPTDLTPRRISDVVEQRHWHGCSAYTEVFSEFGSAHQLSMVTGVFSSHVGVGWTFTRSGGDFTESDVDLATYVLPVLTALERVHGAPRDDVERTLSPRHRLTGREQQVLQSLATGWTAQAIARHFGITERTVRKHLTAIYNKLECHDRLLAVARAKQEGILR